MRENESIKTHNILQEQMTKVATKSNTTSKLDKEREF